MTREQVDKYWEEIKAFKEGEQIQYRVNASYPWDDIQVPLFNGGMYRVAPFKPKVGDIVLVSHNKNDWNESIFFGMTASDKYCTLNSFRYDEMVSGKVIEHSIVDMSTWAYAKPLKK